MSQNAQNELNSAVDQGTDGQVNATPDQVADMSNDGSNVGSNINTAEVDRITSERAERASKAALTSYLKQQGLTQEEAEAYFQQHRDKKAQEAEAEKNNLGMLQQRNAELEKQAADVLQQANNRIIQAEARIQSIGLGIKPDRVDYAVRLAELRGVQIDENGEVDKAAVKSALEEVLKGLPELKANHDGGAGFKIGGAGQQQKSNVDETLDKIFGIKD